MKLNVGKSQFPAIKLPLVINTKRKRHSSSGKELYVGHCDRYRTCHTMNMPGFS